MSSIRLFALAGAALIAACGGAPSPANPGPVQPDSPMAGEMGEMDHEMGSMGAGAAAAGITPQEILDDITYLASDELMGRDTPSPGLEMAAEYLVAEFEEMGLEPAGDAGRYIQRFPYTRTAMIRSQREVSYGDGTTSHVLEYGTDYYVIPAPRPVNDVPVVWGGSAAAPAQDITARAAGKVALFSTVGNPVAGDGQDLLRAFQAAAGGGAVGVGLVLDQTQTADSIRDWASGIAGSGLSVPVPIFAITGESTSRIAEAAGSSMDQLMAATSAVDLEGVDMTVSAPFEVSQHEVPNVVALLRGSDPELSDEYVVYSAHFDHVGVGLPDENGDSIYNGADDDASGVAVMMAAARAYTRLETPPARSVLFLAVSAEEKGLLGSEYFAQNPTVPLGGIIMNINLDMVGRNHPDTVVAIGREYTNLGGIADMIAEMHPEIGLTIIQDPTPEEQSFFRSDHLQFVKQDIPAIFFSTNDHDQYHKPSDHVELIDEEKASRIAKLVFHLGHHIATGHAEAEWLPGALDEVRRIIAENENPGG